MAAATTTQAAPTGGEIRQSRIGKRPIDLPKGVTATLKGGDLEIAGPKGTIARPVPPDVKVAIEGSKVSFVPTVGGRDGARLQGLARALFASIVKGASEGYTKELELVGTGYRAEVKGGMLHLTVGFSHPVALELPKGVTATVPPESKGTHLILAGNDKGMMGQLAAKIRDVRPPEPYGGKGIRYKGEKIRQKAGKSGGKGK
jgi:large subunit ribosomal protein L6